MSTVLPKHSLQTPVQLLVGILYSFFFFTVWKCWASSLIWTSRMPSPPPAAAVSPSPPLSLPPHQYALRLPCVRASSPRAVRGGRDARADEAMSAPIIHIWLFLRRRLFFFFYLSHPPSPPPLSRPPLLLLLIPTTPKTPPPFSSSSSLPTFSFPAQSMDLRLIRGASGSVSTLD